MTSFNQCYVSMLEQLLSHGLVVSPRGMPIRELLFQHLVLEEPRDNIITLKGFKTNIEYAKEELRWYYSGSNNINFSPLIERTWKHFSDDGKTVNSSYGHRIWGHKQGFIDQWQWVKNKLLQDKDSRQCVININSVEDKKVVTKDFPCTIALQIFNRDNKLHWSTLMRSQDIVLGMRNDVYCFTSMQQRMAKELNLGLGSYHHYCASLHLYEKDFAKAEKLFMQENNFPPYTSL